MFQPIVIDRAGTNPAVSIRPSTLAPSPSRTRPAPAARAGSVAGGRKGAPNKLLHAGERVVLADIEGPGIVRHIWLTVPPAPPEQLRGLILEVFYDGADEPSISVPVVDFFGLPHGRPVAYSSALTSVLEGRGFNSYLPMPFRDRIRIELWNSAPAAPAPLLPGRLHAAARPARRPRPPPRHLPAREPHDDAARLRDRRGLRGPGRFLGCNVGVRVIDDADWYGEGEVKVYRDGDTDLPTICGTGLEDYVGSAWGLGRFHSPLQRRAAHRGRGHRRRGTDERQPRPRGLLPLAPRRPDHVRPRACRVTIQQIGAKGVPARPGGRVRGLRGDQPARPGRAGCDDLAPGLLAWGIAERVDDYCATAYVYCTEAQPVPASTRRVATADIARFPYESAKPIELLTGILQGPT